jgi:hypothetical protein
VYLLVWVAVVLGFYSVAASKRGVYMLSLYPAVALLIGWWWDEQCRSDAGQQRWLARVLEVIVWPLLAIAGFASIAVLIEALGAPLCATAQRWLPSDAQPFAPIVSETIRAERWGLLSCLVVAVAALYAVTDAARRVRWRGIFAAMFVAVAAVLVGAQQFIMPGVAQALSLRTFMDEVRRVVGATSELSFYKTFDYAAVFYSQGHISTYAGTWPVGAPRYVLMSQAQWERVQASAGAQYERVTFPSGRQGSGADALILARRTGKQ